MPTPEDLLDLVVDRDSFIAFVKALAAERQEAEKMERDRPDHYQYGGALDWQHSDISMYLDAAVACFQAEADYESSVTPTWKLFAEFLYYGKIYEQGELQIPIQNGEFMANRLEALKAILAPPASPRENGGDWETVERQLGVSLPEDYKQFIEVYGSGDIGGNLSIYNPFAENVHQNLIARQARIAKYYSEYRGRAGEPAPFPIAPELRSNGKSVP
jgi:hypothetical protein